MRKALTTILAVVLFATALPGLTGCFWKRVPKKWYNKTLDYYREGLSSNWANEDPSNGFYIGSDLKVLDASREFGYLITDWCQCFTKYFFVFFIVFRIDA